MVEDMIFRMDYKKLANILEEERKNGKKIVMASGTFDLFHLGHMRMLAAAKKKGDILVVAVKSDRAAALKKEDPPVLDQEIRMETIANYGGTDGDGLPVYEDLALVGEVDAGEHVHQRRFAAAVLSQKGEDLSFPDIQINVVVGHYWTKGLGDAAHPDCVVTFQSCHPFPASRTRRESGS